MPRFFFFTSCMSLRHSSGANKVYFKCIRADNCWTAAAFTDIAVHYDSTRLENNAEEIVAGNSKGKMNKFTNHVSGGSHHCDVEGGSCQAAQ